MINMTNRVKDIEDHKKTICNIFSELIEIEDKDRAKRKLDNVRRALLVKYSKSNGPDKYKFYKQMKGVDHLKKGLDIFNTGRGNK